MSAVDAGFSGVSNAIYWEQPGVLGLSKRFNSRACRW